MALCVILGHHKHCAHVYQGVLVSSCLRYLNNARSLQMKFNWQGASYVHSLHRGVPGGDMSVTTCIMSLCLWVKIILVYSNLVDSTLTTKLPNSTAIRYAAVHIMWQSVLGLLHEFYTEVTKWTTVQYTWWSNVSLAMLQQKGRCVLVKYSTEDVHRFAS